MQGKKSNDRKARMPVQDRGIEKRERIINAGRELFESKGYHGCNSKDIAARAGVAVGTFYGYFDDKKSVFLEVISRYYYEISKEALTIDQNDLKELGNPHKIVGIIIERMLAAHRISPNLHREIISMIYRDIEIQELIHNMEEEVIKRLLTLFHIVQDKLKVKDLEAAVRIVHRSAEEVIHSIRIFSSPIEEERLVGELQDMLYRYLFT